MQFCLCYIPCANISEAKNIAKKLVEEKVVACANILPEMISIYEWNENIEESNEVLLLLKISVDLFENVKNRVVELHSYKCPCVLRFDIQDGNAEYLQWLSSCLVL